jgi:hypothetical protein
LLSTVTARNHTHETSSTETSSVLEPLPSVVGHTQQATEDSSGSTSTEMTGKASATMTASSTGSGEAGSEVANEAGRPVVRSMVMALVMFATVVFVV